MESSFAASIARLRHDKNLSQRMTAAELGISQALLSHYENGLREPKLDFVVRICDYYGVSADYVLGRTEIRENPVLAAGLDPLKPTGREMSVLLDAVAVLFHLAAETADGAAVDMLYRYFGAEVFKAANILGAGDVGSIRWDAARCALCDAEICLAEAGLDGCANPDGAAAVMDELLSRFPDVSAAFEELMKQAGTQLRLPQMR